ncbi:hypothetical protein LMG28688_06245 [Paraburkholderia caffeinitolerans]|uniref:Uncharacterized protein n=1 Tax=Paraburkholderia caffeinitolerans TaxID=1723730 RepID=A0A6J5GSN6_9BURK|nr:hypothetical protein [Paraburkholderia caffeinitolerans]CAB3805745.1 hypothetical protein LMG28688_06245 [Paraburkholderia caffeinitolerans]
MRINVNIPVRLSVDLDAIEHRPADLDAALAAAMARAMRRSSAVTARSGDPTAIVVHDPTFLWRGANLRSVTADTRQDTEARLARVIQRSARTQATSPATGTTATSASLRRRPWRGWQTLTSINFHAKVGEYLAYLDSSIHSRLTDYATLYADYEEQLKWVSLWVVRVDRPYRRDDLSAELSARASELSRAHPGREDGFWVINLSEPDRQRVIEVDRDNLVAGATPDLRSNSRYLRVYGGELYLMPGAQAIFTMMVLPTISLETYARLGTPADVEVRNRDLEFLVYQDGFRDALGVSWTDFIAGMGDETTTLHVSPVEVTAPVLPTTLQQLVETRDPLPPAGPIAYPKRDLFLLNQSTLDTLPETVRTAVAPLTTPATLALDADGRWGRWQVGWRGAVLSASFALSENQQFTVSHRARAEQIADAIVTLLGSYPQGDSLAEIPWWSRLDALCTSDLGARAGGAGGLTIFDLWMEALERRDGGRWFDALLDKMASTRGDAALHFIQAATVSAHYNAHPRISQMRSDYNNATRAALKNRYFPDSGAIWLHHDADRRVARNGVVADAYADYASHARVKHLREERRAEFDTALETAANQLLADIMAGRVAKDFNNQEFANEAINRAVAAIHLSNDDFETVTQITSLRVTAIEFVVDRGIERYNVTFNMVQKIEGESSWTDLPGTSRTSTELEFEWLLFGWDLGRMGDRLETVGLVIGGIAVIAVAWEAGIVTALVEAAGGTGAVLTSVFVSEILYLATAKHYSLEGFVMAAIDGYLFALTFRFAGIGGRAIALRIGRATMSDIVGGWVAERLFVGVVGGSLGGGAVVFSHGLADTLLHDGPGPSLGQYVRGMTMGAVFGLFGEFVIGPALQGAFRVGGQTVLNTADEAIGVIRRSGVSPARYAAEISQALSAIRERLATFLEESSVQTIITGLRERMATLGEGLSLGAIGRRFEFSMFRRVFELADIGMGSVETDGLERLLSTTESGAARMSQEELLAFLNRVALDKDRARQLLNALGRLTDERAGALIGGGQLEGLASSSNLLHHLTTGDINRIWDVLAGPSFRLSAADCDAFLGRLAHFTDEQQISALEILRRPDQLVTPEGVAQALEKGGLDAGVGEGLDRLYGALESAAADTLMRAIPAADAPGYLHWLGSQRQEIVNQLAQDGYLAPLASAPHALDFIGRNGFDSLRSLTGAHGPFGTTIAEAVAGLDAFAGALRAFSQDQQDLAVATLLRAGNRVPPDSLLFVLQQQLTLDAELQRALDNVYAERSGMTVQEFQRLTGARFDSALRGLYRSDLQIWRELGHIEAITRHDEVMEMLRHGANRALFRTFVGRYPGNEGVAIDALGRLLSRVRALSGGNLQRFEMTDLIQALQSVSDRGPTPLAEIDQIAADIGQSGFPTRTVGTGPRATTFPSAAEEARAYVRLLGDNVTPAQAQTMLTLPTDVNVSTVEVAGEGERGPDVLLTTDTGQTIGRESVATRIPTVDRADPLGSLQRNLNSVSLSTKVDAYASGGTYARRGGIRWLRREIDVRIDPSVDGFSYDALLAQMQADGSLAPFLDRVIRDNAGWTNISRIRFYNSRGALVHTWTP